MGLFDGIGEAKAGGQNVYFLAGTYTVRVHKVFAMQSRKKEDLFIAECNIDASTNEARPMGSKASWVVNMKHDAALGNIKGFVAAANGIDPVETLRVDAEVTTEVVEYVVSDDNPLQDIELRLTCTDIETRAGNPFTLHAWEPAE